MTIIAIEMRLITSILYIRRIELAKNSANISVGGNDISSQLKQSLALTYLWMNFVKYVFQISNTFGHLNIATPRS